MMQVHRVNFVQLDLGREVLHHREEVEHEPVPGHHPLVDLELLPLRVALKDLPEKVQSRVSRRRIGEDRVYQLMKRGLG